MNKNKQKDSTSQRGQNTGGQTQHVAVAAAASNAHQDTRSAPDSPVVSLRAEEHRKEANHNAQQQQQAHQLVASCDSTQIQNVIHAEEHIDAVIRKMMQADKNDQQAQSDGCSALWKVSCDPTQIQKAVVIARGGMEALLCAVEALISTTTPSLYDDTPMRKNAALQHKDAGLCKDGGLLLHKDSDSEHVLITACAALCNLTADSTGRDALFNTCMKGNSSIKTIVAVMDAHKNNTKLHSTACHIIRNLSLASCSAVKDVIRNHGAIENIVSALTTHKGDVGAVKECLATLYTVSVSNAANKLAIGQCRGIETLVSVIMKRHASNVEVLRAACALLYSLTFSKDNVAALLHITGGLNVVTDCMNQHKHDSNMQKHRFGILWNICVQHASFKHAARALLHTDALIEIMVAHRHHGCVQGQACGLLSTLAARHTAVQNLVREKKGMLAVISALKLNSENCFVQRYGCCALWNLVYKNVENGAVVCEFQGVQTILLAMKTHVLDVDVQHYGCGTLQELAKDHKLVLAVRRQNEVIGIVINAMSAHAGSADVQRRACAALWRIAPNGADIENFRPPGGIERVICALRTYEDNTAVQYKACAALMQFCKANSNKEQVVKCGGIQALVTAMSKHRKHGCVQHAASEALLNLSHQFAQSVVDHGGVPLLINAMCEHTLRMATIACGALSTLALTDTCRQVIDVCVCVCVCIHRDTQRMAIHTHACK
jgi:hypothetical protein